MEGKEDGPGPMICSNGIDDDETNADGIDGSVRIKPVISSEQMDVEAYAGLYTGRTKIMRLIFIADQCEATNPQMQLEALRMAFDETKKGENTQLHREVASKIMGRLGPAYEVDLAWAESIDRRADQRKEKLENELNSYRTNLIKESIRMGHNDFGDFYYAHGSLGDAFRHYVRTRDYCTTSRHILQMCFNVILVSIEMGQFMHVTNYVSKAEQTPEPLDPVIVSKLRCAAGLAHLDSKKYKLAARKINIPCDEEVGAGDMAPCGTHNLPVIRTNNILILKFLETGPELGNNYTEVIAPQDVATYGGLCALASFDRTELKAYTDLLFSFDTDFSMIFNKVIDNINFRNFLELVPEVRELIHDFYSSRYASCLEYLENLKPNLLLDIHLYDHVETLYNQIRHKAIIQYTHPFISVDLHTMATAFKTTVAGMEKELEALITDDQIQRALQTGIEFDRDVRAMLLRASLVKHDYNLRASRKM
ncbi:COP9/signalosome complex subunit Csn1 [Asimina triloba]